MTFRYFEPQRHRERREEKRFSHESFRTAIDEAGIDNRDDYPYGYCEIGKRFEALRSGRRTERVSWIAALKEKEIFAPMTFTGSVSLLR